MTIPMPRARSAKTLARTPTVPIMLLTRVPTHPSNTLTHSSLQVLSLHSLQVATVQVAAAVMADTLNRAAVAIAAMVIAPAQTMVDTLAPLPTMAMVVVVLDHSVALVVTMADHLVTVAAAALAGMVKGMGLVQVDVALLLPTMVPRMATTTDTNPGVTILALEATGSTLHSSSAILTMAVHIRPSHEITCPIIKRKRNKIKTQQTISSSPFFLWYGESKKVTNGQLNMWKEMMLPDLSRSQEKKTRWLYRNGSPSS